MTTLSGPALRVTVFLGEDDRYHHRPLSTEIVHRAHAAGLAGASVVRGCEGFGASSRIHTARLVSLSEDLPVIVIIVDEFPMTVTGKVRKVEMREKAVELLGLQDAADAKHA